MTHFWADGRALSVACDETGRPSALTWEGIRYRVLRVADRWRVDDEWWAERVWREYYWLTTEFGMLVLVYRDLLTGDWYLQRMYN